MNKAEAPNTADREVAMTRVIDAPRQVVWDAWTDPTRLAAWWGPDGFTNTFEVFEAIPGGRWRFVMQGPDGVNYPNRSVFIEVVKPERIVFRHTSGPYFLTTVTFTAQGDKTLLSWRMLFDTVAEYEKVKGCLAEGNRQNLDNLAVHLAAIPGGSAGTHQ